MPGRRREPVGMEFALPYLDPAIRKTLVRRERIAAELDRRKRDVSKWIRPG